VNFYDQCEVSTSFRDIEAIINSGIFTPENFRSPFFKASFIAMLVELRALMYKTEKYAEKINFTDDVLQHGKVKDVSDLIKFVRDAVCHPDIPHHHLDDGNRASFNVSFGAGCPAHIGEQRQEALYDDDVCFFFGMQHIYLKRHVLRALNEAREKLSPLLDKVGL
jgi:hypothetical protein